VVGFIIRLVSDLDI